ncbi:hypothetical protein [Persicobacter psychrovividus]|uniref:YcxB-like protein domain-containing protein n=1 Tax=Persicobacter psychrovividus TaxID=387638 RepID=A0ABN6L8J3_9BACT|nr:hypothetical protein PEPS_17290 [Persicobacter psychrovividus]
MQRQVIYLTNGYMSPRARFLLLAILGAAFVAVSILSLIFMSDKDGIFIAFMSMLLVAGGIMLADAYLLRPGSRSMPRYEVDDDQILIINDEISGRDTIYASDIKQIHLASFEVIVDFFEQDRLIISIATEDAEVSKEVKSAIFTFASENNIPVIGG